MINRRYLILYLVVATVALLMGVYLIITGYPDVNFGRVVLDGLVALLFYYLAYKTYHEKKDKELM